MPVWGALLGTLGWNFRRHRQHRSTICSTTRRVVPGWAFVCGWALLTVWIVRHYLHGFDRN